MCHRIQRKIVEGPFFKNQSFRRVDDTVISLYPGLSRGLTSWLPFLFGHKTYLNRLAILFYRACPAHFIDKHLWALTNV